MHTRSLGQSGIEASVIGLGTWAMGGWMWGGVQEKAAIDAIHVALDAGVTLIDSAPAYGLGLSEEIVGKAIAGRRDQVILATKCGMVWHTQEGNFAFIENDRSVHRYLGAESIKYEVEQSLRRFGTDYIDLYQPHWPDVTTPISETMTALLDLKKEGKIRAIGVSNVDVQELESYWQTGPLDSAQLNYSMLDREIEAEIVPFCREKGMAILAYSPLALGLLTSKIGPERQFTGDDQRINNPRFSIDNRQRVAALLEQFQPIAERYQLTIAQLVIAWTLHQPGITHALCGARNPQQALENVKAGTVTLSETDLKTMNDLVHTRTASIV